jgi:FkbM family methyltransferase
MRNAKVRESLRLLRRLQVPVSHVIDVGIQHGTPALIEVFPDLHHSLFEPVEEYYPQIRRRYAQLGHDLVEAAVADRDGEMLLQTQKKTRGDEISHSFLTDKPSPDTRRVRVLRLDSHFAAHSPDNRYLLKIDVEGPDVPAAILRGARGILDKVAVVVIEMTVDRFMDRAILLHEAGFDVWDICDLCYYGDCLWQFDAVFLRRELKQALPALRPMTAGPFRKDLWQSGF